MNLLLEPSPLHSTTINLRKAQAISFRDWNNLSSESNHLKDEAKTYQESPQGEQTRVAISATVYSTYSIVFLDKNSEASIEIDDDLCDQICSLIGSKSDHLIRQFVESAVLKAIEPDTEATQSQQNRDQK